MQKYQNFSKEELIKVIDNKNHTIYSLNGKINYLNKKVDNYKNKLKGINNDK